MRALTSTARALLLTLALVALRAPDAGAQTCLSPTGVSASDGTLCSAVTISWSGGQRGDTFKIFRAETPNAAQATLIGQTTSATFTDSQALEGVVYYYFVQRLNASCPAGSPLAGGNSGFVGTPPALTGLTASDQTSCASVHLSWNIASTALLYQIWRSLTSNVNNATLIAITDTTIFDDTTADPKLTYYYFVRGFRGSCFGSFQSVAEPGGKKTPVLPDLVPIAEAFDPPTVIAFSDGHAELFFTSVIANIGTAPFEFRHLLGFGDGTFEFVQSFVDVCTSGNTQLRTVGRAKLPTISNPATFAHFLRVTLRNRAAVSGQGEARAQVDLPASCVRDGDAYFSTLPGSPINPKYTSCTSPIHGISIGWGFETALGDNGQRLHLHCVSSGDYELEAVVDPDDLIEEFDETNNVIRIPLTLSNLPTFDPATCPAPAIDARLLGPDSLAAAVGAASDTFTARVWMAGVSGAAGPPPIPHVKIGYALASEVTFERASAVDKWTWAPATWLRQDGEADVWGGTVAVPQPGEYRVTFRVDDLDALSLLLDRDGTNNDFEILKTSKLSVRTTTDAGPATPTGVALALDAWTDPGRGATRFRIGLPTDSRVTLSIYDVRGRIVRTLERGARQAGAHDLEWDGRDASGRLAPRAIYFARLETSAGAPLVTKFFASTP